MFIKNTTDKGSPKVVGVGDIWLHPGEEKYVSNEKVYVDEVNFKGKKTGKKVVLPAILAQKRLGYIEYREDPADMTEEEKEEAENPTVEENPVAEEAPVVEEEKPAEKPARTRKKKTE